MSTNNKSLKHKRILLKLSGEALSGDQQFGINPVALSQIAEELMAISKLGVELGLVLGAGNLFRGSALTATGISRVTGDHIGMLATVMNALAMQDALVRLGNDCRVLSAISITGLVQPFEMRSADDFLSDGKIIIFTAGTGHPFFTTDTAACLRAIEVGADAIYKATKVDGVYSTDPHLDANAVKYDNLSYDQVLEQKLAVMDATAICMCRDNDLPIYVYSMDKANGLQAILQGAKDGTLISRGSA